MGLETSGPLLWPAVKFSTEVTGLNFLQGVSRDTIKIPG